MTESEWEYTTFWKKKGTVKKEKYNQQQRHLRVNTGMNQYTPKSIVSKDSTENTPLLGVAKSKDTAFIN